jgi:hypothetical protein
VLTALGEAINAPNTARKLLSFANSIELGSKKGILMKRIPCFSTAREDGERSEPLKVNTLFKI